MELHPPPDFPASGRGSGCPTDSGEPPGVEWRTRQCLAHRTLMTDCLPVLWAHGSASRIARPSVGSTGEPASNKA
eukprot:6470151-Alexandrium_andersonii.AAC.1